MSRALICVPTYNEVENVEPLSLAIMEQAPPAADVLFIDDGSPDGTGKLLDQMAAANPRIHVLHRANKQGLATAYIQGFRWGLDRGYDWFFEMDADFSHQPLHLPSFFAEFDTHDVVCGSRYVDGGGVSNWDKGRLALSQAGSVYTRMLLRYPVRDWTGGFNAWSREALEQLRLETIRSRGYTFQIEMKYRALTLGLRLKEVPIVFQERRAGQSKMNGSIVKEAVWGVLRLRFAEQAGELFG